MRTLPAAHGSRWVLTSLAIAADCGILLSPPKTMFSAAKDLMTSKAAKAYANDFIQHYGRVEELTIDSKRNRIEVVCRLNGEVSPIGVTIEKYLIERRDGKVILEVLDSSATRPWLQAVMRDHLHGRKIDLPSWAAAAL